MKSPLYIAAGPKALRHLQENGLQLADIRAMLGASGGPKWLVLNQLDRLLAPRLAADPLVNMDLLGTSIGSWRFACYTQPDPLAAIDRFEEAYFEQAYSRKPSPVEISQVCSRILESLLEGQHRAIVSNSQRRLHTIANRCRPVMLDRNGEPSKVPLGAAALMNVMGRHQLRHFFERILFAPPSSQLPFHPAIFRQENVQLATDNLHQALMATASIHSSCKPSTTYREVQGVPAWTVASSTTTSTLRYPMNTASYCNCISAHGWSRGGLTRCCPGASHKPPVWITCC